MRWDGSVDHWSRRAWHDLVWGSTCVGCGAPGPALCHGCRQAPLTPLKRLGDEGLRCVSAADHAGPWGRAVVAHKERGVRELGDPMAHLLASTVLRVVDLAAPAPVLLVPVPSRPDAVRERGEDPWARVVRGAVRVLRRSARQQRWTLAPLLVAGRRSLDQGGLDASQREANLRGALRVSPGGVLRARRRHPGPVRVVVCDDVVTTGATVREAARALGASGISTACAVTVTAARLRSGQEGHDVTDPPSVGPDG